MPESKSLIAEWAREYTGAMFVWTLARVSDEGVAEDLVQDTFLSALKSVGNFKGESNPKTWLFSILKNKIADHFRKQFKLPTVSESKLGGSQGDDFFSRFFDKDDEWRKEYASGDWLEDEGELLDNLDFRDVLQKCLQALSKKSLLAVQYKYLEEKDGKIICQELEISPSNFWQLLHRAKVQLRDCLYENWFKK